MEMSYRDAMDQLRSMFTGFDEETIKTILTTNDGHVERTIEDLLKMNDENEKHQNQDDDNLFADSGPKHRSNIHNNLFSADPYPSNNNALFGSNYDSGRLAKEKQEQEDAALAYRLQREYMQQEAQLERAERSQQRRPQANPYTSYSNNNYPPAGSHMDSNVDSNRYAQSNAYNDVPARHSVDDGSKKKPGIMSKMKASIGSLFHKKKGNKQAPTHNPGSYAEIENLEEHDVYNLNDDGPLRETGLRGSEQNANQDDDAPMQLSDVLVNQRRDSVLDSDGEDSYDHNHQGYNNNQNQRVAQDNYGYH